MFGIVVTCTVHIMLVDSFSPPISCLMCNFGDLCDGKYCDCMFSVRVGGFDGANLILDIIVNV